MIDAAKFPSTSIPQRRTRPDAGSIPGCFHLKPAGGARVCSWAKAWRDSDASGHRLLAASAGESQRSVIHVTAGQTKLMDHHAVRRMEAGEDDTVNKRSIAAVARAEAPPGPRLNAAVSPPILLGFPPARILSGFPYLYPTGSNPLMPAVAQ